MDDGFPGAFLFGGAGVLLLEGGVHQRQADGDADGVDDDADDCHHKGYRRGSAEDRLQHGESQEADCRRSADKGRDGGVGAGVLLEAEVDEHEADHDTHGGDYRQLDVLDEHFAGGLHDGDEQGGGQCVVKHHFVEFLGVFSREDPFLAGNIAGEHHHDYRDDGIQDYMRNIHILEVLNS